MSVALDGDHFIRGHWVGSTTQIVLMACIEKI